ncbi:zinc-binding dehydrogenase [Micromonospora sp. HUAS LYJ1]|uniref:zinc-binding dehydrogenase n=1 Tax=Micromonospora sp. HUAS LYJ1 TaxID=3061626 RepID=UPI002672B44D|nr:zinc-binding dehydrogenase [Micromonospora sp. HUAS LYJ1]WKU03550.1 zinc-binding dehydrogenase [Micromonospora sp. HUAS LYJ1]
MRAARLVEGRSDLVIEEVPDPAVPAGWAMVEVGAAGLCHTDLHLMDGVQFTTRFGKDYTIRRPRVLGHEIAGTVVRVGAGVTSVAVGDRVAVGGRREPGTSPGLHIDGGFAQFCSVPATELVAIPDHVSFAAAAVATDSILSAYVAVTRAGEVRSGEVVGIVGLGALGMSGLRAAVLAGAEAHGVDLDADRRDAGVGNGAVSCFGSVEDLADVRPSLVVDFVGGKTTRTALDVVQPGGRVVVIGLESRDLTIDAFSLILGRKRLIGALGSDHTEDFESVVRHLAAGDFAPTTEIIDFDDIGEGFARLRAGSVRGRLVVQPNGAPA